jgi:hypothetical protein
MPTTILTDTQKYRAQFNGSGTTNVAVRTVAAYNPITVELIRKDFTGTTIQSVALPLYESIDLGSLAAELSVGDFIYVNASIMAGNFEVLDITGNVVTFDFLWSVAGAQSGYFNILTRLNWYLTLRIQAATSVDDFVDLRLTPKGDGTMRAEISGAIQQFISLNFGAEFGDPLGGGYTIYRSVFLLFASMMLNWKENWIGSDEAFTTRSSISDRFFALGGAFQIGDVNDGYYINYYANVEGEAGSSENLPLWLTRFPEPVYFEGFRFTKSWLSNNLLGNQNLYQLKKTYLTSNGTVISTDTYSLGGATTYLYPTIIDVTSNPTVAPDPDNRRFIKLEIQRISDSKNIITPLLCRYVPVSQQNCNTFYVRWLNDIGGWDYFLFENKVYEGDVITSQGEYETYFDSIASTSDYQNFVGKQTTPIARVGCDFVDENIAIGLRGLKSSPKVYWYNESISKWIGVKVQVGSFAFRTTKTSYSKVELTFELPRLLNQTA